jgi:hypothetical protein
MPAQTKTCLTDPFVAGVAAIAGAEPVARVEINRNNIVPPDASFCTNFLALDIGL